MVLAFILIMLALFGVSVFVHELGHFLVAKLFRMEATVFSIGMGKPIWSKQVGGTRWQIGWLPLGGYVALPQMDPNSFLEDNPPGDSPAHPGDASEGQPPSPARPSPLPDVAPWKKICVAVAGATGNILFAFLLGTIVWICGKPSSPEELNAYVGFVDPDRPAAEAGIRPGDEIIAVGATPVHNWIDIVTEVALSPGGPVRLTLLRASSADKPAASASRQTLTVTVPPTKSSLGNWMLDGVWGMDLCNVAAVSPGTGAEAAGLRPGDQILAYAGQKVYSRAHLASLVDAQGTAPAPIQVLRSGETIDATVTATYNEELGRHLIGIMFNTVADVDYAILSHPTPWAQVKGHVRSIVQFLKALVVPRTAASAAGAVGGPVSIFVMLYLLIKTSFMLALWFTGFLNVNLAIINLLPLPVLDGGHVILNLWSWITRRPLSARFVNALATTFAILFIVLFLFLTFRDSKRQLLPMLRDSLHRDAPPAAEEQPSPPSALP